MKSCAVVLLGLVLWSAMGSAAWAVGIVTTSPGLPPTQGVYRSLEGVTVEYAGPGVEVLVQPILFQPFAFPPPVVADVGMDETQTFEASLLVEAEVTADALGLEGELVQMELAGPVQTIVLGKSGFTTGDFQAEIVSMTLSGEFTAGGLTVPVIIREDLAQPSQGDTDIVDLGGGLYHIDSFFDVFTELSVDGGASWIGADSSMRFVLVAIPEPAALWLTSLSVFWLAMGRRRK